MDTDAFITFTSLLALFAGALALALGGLWLASTRFDSAAARLDRVLDSLGDGYLAVAFLVALASTLGSLYYSEVANFEPCRLCWYQRIAMYPLVVVLGIAAVRRDRSIWRYAAPLAVIGGGIAVYHYLLQQFPSLGSGACAGGVPCNAAYVWEFGFVSIPFMALCGFALITVLLLVKARPAE